MTPTLEKLAEAVLAKRGEGTVDGRARPADHEAKLNALAHRVVNDPDFAGLWQWLREITVLTVLGANASDAELRYQEGMRGLVALIEARALAHDRKHSEQARGTPA